MRLHFTQPRLGITPIWGTFRDRISDCGAAAHITGNTLIAVSYINSAVISNRPPEVVGSKKLACAVFNFGISNLSCKVEPYCQVLASSIFFPPVAILSENNFFSSFPCAPFSLVFMSENGVCMSPREGLLQGSGHDVLKMSSLNDKKTVHLKDTDCGPGEA